MLKSPIIGIIGVMVGAAAVEAIFWTNSKADGRMASAATGRMPSISELHARVCAQALPDFTGQRALLTTGWTEGDPIRKARMGCICLGLPSGAEFFPSLSKTR